MHKFLFSFGKNVKNQFPSTSTSTSTSDGLPHKQFVLITKWRKVLIVGKVYFIQQVKTADSASLFLLKA